MKKWNLYLVLLVLALMSASAQAAITHLYNFLIDPEEGLTGLEDHVGTADFTVHGGVIFVDCCIEFQSNGDYVSMPADEIAINTYDELTLELWSIQSSMDQGYSMTAAFGDTYGDDGIQYVAISTSGAGVSRAMITDGSINPGWMSERGVDGPEYNDDLLHQYVLTIGPDESSPDTQIISYFIDGAIVGSNSTNDNTLAGLSNSFAYLGKSLYAGDATFIGRICEFSIYDTALSSDEVLATFAEGPNCVPEPATMFLLGLGSVVVLRRKKS